MTLRKICIVFLIFFIMLYFACFALNDLYIEYIILDIEFGIHLCFVLEPSLTKIANEIC